MVDLDHSVEVISSSLRVFFEGRRKGVLVVQDIVRLLVYQPAGLEDFWIKLGEGVIIVFVVGGVD